MIEGFSQYERGTSTAPFLLAQVVAGATVSAVVDPDMIPFSSPTMSLTPKQRQVLSAIRLSTEEQSDNTRYDSLMKAIPANQMRRVSYWWPVSFFEQNGQQVHLHYLTTPGLDQNSLGPNFYDYRPTVTRFGKQSEWFKIWSSSDLKPAFIYRKGDVINFGGGHTSIVVGDNAYGDVVVSEMSYNRARQAYATEDAFDTDFDPASFDNYGVTRDKLSDLRSGLGPARIAGVGRPENAFTEKQYFVYRLMPWLTAPDPQFSQLNHLSTQAQLPYRRYTVVKGDTLSGIPQKTGTSASVADLADANGIPDAEWIQAGDVLIVP